VITKTKEMKADAKKAKLKAVQLAIQVRQKGISGMPSIEGCTRTYQIPILTVLLVRS